MTLAYPEQWVWLWLIPVLAGGWWWAFQRRRDALAQIAQAAVLPQLTASVHWGARRVKAVLVILGLSLLLLSLMGPMWGFTWQEVQRRNADIVIAIDVSKSMLAEDVTPNRLERAKLAIQDLLAELHGERVALVAFAGSSFLQCPLTIDYGAFRLALDDLSVETIPYGGTALARAIRYGVKAFENATAEARFLLLITDGENHIGDAQEAAREAAESGISIYTIGMGSVAGELIPVRDDQGQRSFLKDPQGRTVKSRLEESVLQQIAIATGGSYVRMTGSALWLDQIYREHIAKLSTEVVEGPMRKQPLHRFQWVLALALLLLGLEPLVSERVREPGRRSAMPTTLGRQGSAGLVLLLCLLSAGRVEAATDDASQARLRERVETALERDPDNPALQYNLGTLKYHEGAYERAVEALQRSTFSPDASLQARAFYNLGNALYRQGEAQTATEPNATIERYEEALQSYRAAIHNDPSDRDAQYNYELTARRLEELKVQQAQQQEQQDQQQNQERQEGEQEQRSAAAEDQDTGGSDAGDEQAGETAPQRVVEPSDEGSTDAETVDAVSPQQAVWILDRLQQEERSMPGLAGKHEVPRGDYVEFDW